MFFLPRFFSVPKTVELCGPISLAWKLIDSKNKPLFHRRTHLCGEVIHFFNARGGFFYGRSAVRKWISLRCECFTTWKKMPASAGLRVSERRVLFSTASVTGDSHTDFSPWLLSFKLVVLKRFHNFAKRSPITTDPWTDPYPHSPHGWRLLAAEGDRNHLVKTTKWSQSDPTNVRKSPQTDPILSQNGPEKGKVAVKNEWMAK